jgi:hypothetical protein
MTPSSPPTAPVVSAAPDGSHRPSGAPAAAVAPPQDNIQSIHHARPRLCVRLHTAVCPSMPLTLRVLTAIACMDQPDHSLQYDHRSPGLGHGLSLGSLAHRALMLTWSIPVSTQLGIRSAPFHGRPPYPSGTALLVSPYMLPHESRRILCSDGFLMVVHSPDFFRGSAGFFRGSAGRIL